MNQLGKQKRRREKKIQIGGGDIEGKSTAYSKIMWKNNYLERLRRGAERIGEGRERKRGVWRRVCSER